MANDINRVFLIGRLTRDPELRSTPSGSYYSKFSIASNRSYTKKDGTLQEDVGYFDCTAWGKTAEVISKYLQKGRRVAIEGSLKWSQWENQEGKKQSKVEVGVENFQFLDPKTTSPEAPSHSNQQESSSSPQDYSQKPPQESSGEIIDDDIPF